MNKPKPIVLLDVDGVLTSWADQVLAVVNTVTGRHYKPDGWLSVDKLPGLDASDREIIHSILNAKGFARGLRPYSAAQEGVKWLKEIATVFYVTSSWRSNPTWESDRRAWLVEHGFTLPAQDTVIFTSHKELVRGDILVDDNVQNLKVWQARNVGKPSVLWLTEYNKRDWWPCMSESWYGLYRKVKGLL